MFSIKDKVSFSIFVLISCIVLATGDDFKDDSLDRGALSDKSGVWFGPRLGKRSLQLSSDDNRQTFFKLLEAADALKFYYDQLPAEMLADEPPKVSKKVIFTPKLGRAMDQYTDKRTYDNVDFTPRLGRRKTPEIPMTLSEEDIYKPDPVILNARNNYFSPRLGRHVNFSPRLGREINYDLYPENIRLARSINNTKET